MRRKRWAARLLLRTNVSVIREVAAPAAHGFGYPVFTMLCTPSTSWNPAFRGTAPCARRSCVASLIEFACDGAEEETVPNNHRWPSRSARKSPRSGTGGSRLHQELCRAAKEQERTEKSFCQGRWSQVFIGGGGVCMCLHDAASSAGNRI